MAEDENNKDNEQEEQAPVEQEQAPGNPLDNLDANTQKKIQEIQVVEQNFQQLLMQKQTFTFEINETNLALEELKKSEGEVFKLVGNQIILKTTKDKLEQELESKKTLLDTRLKSIDKQEKEFSEKLNSLREEIMKEISPNSP